MKKEKVKSRADRVTLKGRSIEDDAAEATKFLHFQQNISRLSDSELNIKFEQMLVIYMFEPLVKAKSADMLVLAL